MHGLAFSTGPWQETRCHRQWLKCTCGFCVGQLPPRTQSLVLERRRAKRLQKTARNERLEPRTVGTLAQLEQRKWTELATVCTFQYGIQQDTGWRERMREKNSAWDTGGFQRGPTPPINPWDPQKAFFLKISKKPKVNYVWFVTNDH